MHILTDTYDKGLHTEDPLGSLLEALTIDNFRSARNNEGKVNLIKDEIFSCQDWKQAAQQWLDLTFPIEARGKERLLVDHATFKTFVAFQLELKTGIDAARNYLVKFCRSKNYPYALDPVVSKRRPPEIPPPRRKRRNKRRNKGSRKQHALSAGVKSSCVETNSQLPPCTLGVPPCGSKEEVCSGNTHAPPGQEDHSRLNLAPYFVEHEATHLPTSNQHGAHTSWRLGVDSSREIYPVAQDVLMGAPEPHLGLQAKLSYPGVPYSNQGMPFPGVNYEPADNWLYASQYDLSRDLYVEEEDEHTNACPSGDICNVCQPSSLQDKEKPPLTIYPPIWAQSRQELCESFGWFRSYQGGVYYNRDIVKGYLLGGFSASRDRFEHDGRLIISHGGGKAASIHHYKGHSTTQLADDQLAQDKSVRALLRTYRESRPLVLVIDNKYALFPYDLSSKNVGYAVLGFYTIAHAWAEYQTARNERGCVIRYKFAFQWCDGQDQPWWIQDVAKDLPASSPQDVFSRPTRRTPVKVSEQPLDVIKRPPVPQHIYRLCYFCREQSPKVYAQGWACLNAECPLFWTTGCYGQRLPEILSYNRAFLKYMRPFTLPISLANGLKPGQPDSSNCTGIITTYASTRGWHCDLCGINGRSGSAPNATSWSLADQLLFTELNPGGEPYQYVGGTDNTIPFDRAPSAVVAARKLIQSRVSKALNRPLDFNEVLSAAYMERQRMAFHSDSERGLGPLVAGLSLGSPALMHFRLLAKYEPIREQRQIALSFVLRHGDILVMDGAQVQEYYEHTVVPSNFRIAATARYIGKEHSLPGVTPQI
ncbi:hypothetical protein AMATHDRAFT_985 [Amanita thiersii Skay4041]|uniref:Alpha-ketoglutarate-dependent dioxygenase AlkB-like domain-containing protein n=1 Tax=Amanita thiersii Skay4041 TaxID=703135 RepID=A0A2A9NWG1_9AGAR|nr:hypothetical protein AMATHDRAFT_985 [Amanita thiersii Skay4041]